MKSKTPSLAQQVDEFQYWPPCSYARHGNNDLLVAALDVLGSIEEKFSDLLFDLDTHTHFVKVRKRTQAILKQAEQYILPPIERS